MEEWSEDDMANTWKDLSFDELVAANRPELMRREAQFGGEENAGRAGSDQSAQSAHWEEFYKRNKEAFFRDRRYLLRDYPELVALVPQNARIAEWGCGVGNALWGLLQERPLFRADAFDCAASAVALVNERRDPRVSCVRWDPSEMQSPSPFAPSSLQCSLFFFFLSALRDRETLVRVARECFLATRPGGIAIVRDYGVYDMTMLRFAGKGGRKVAECVYQRHDGTLTHFFTREEVEAVFCDAGFVCVRSGYEARELRNRKTKEKMYRNWVSAVFVRAHDVAVLGGGVQGVRLAQRLVDSRLFKVAALFDPDRKAATGLSQLVGGVVANSAEEACQANNVLAVLVASPPRAHEEGATIASKCGKLALVEKPLAHSPESAARICKLFEHSALSACTNFWYGSARAGRVITERARALGALKYTRLHARFESWPRPWQANAGEWLSDTARGGGFLREVGSHFLFLVVRLLGPGEWKLQQSDIEMADRCERSLLARLLHVPSGAIVELDMATQPPASMRFEIEACSGEKVLVTDWCVVDGREEEVSGRDEAECWSRFMLGDETAMASLEEGRAVAELVSTILKEKH